METEDVIRLQHQGRWYSARWRVIGDSVEVVQGLSSKRATLLDPTGRILAEQLLFELVVREGKGVPDP